MSELQDVAQEIGKDFEERLGMKDTKIELGTIEDIINLITQTITDISILKIDFSEEHGMFDNSWDSYSDIALGELDTISNIFNHSAELKNDSHLEIFKSLLLFLKDKTIPKLRNYIEYEYQSSIKFDARDKLNIDELKKISTLEKKVSELTKKLDFTI